MARKNSPNPEMDEARNIALDKALLDIAKRYGDMAIMRLGEAHHLEVEVIPTGALSLDIALSQKFMDRNLLGKPLFASTSFPKLKN
jgi:hypothetical protein